MCSGIGVIGVGEGCGAGLTIWMECRGAKRSSEEGVGRFVFFSCYPSLSLSLNSCFFFKQNKKERKIAHQMGDGGGGGLAFVTASNVIDRCVVNVNSISSTVYVKA